MTKEALWAQFILTSTTYILSILFSILFGLFREEAIPNNTVIYGLSLYSGFLSIVSLLLLTNFYLAASTINRGRISRRLVSSISLIPFFGILFFVPPDDLIAISNAIGLPKLICYPADLDGFYHYSVISIYSIFTFVPGSILFLVTSTSAYIFASLWARIFQRSPLGDMRNGRVE